MDFLSRQKGVSISTAVRAPPPIPRCRYSRRDLASALRPPYSRAEPPPAPPQGSCPVLCPPTWYSKCSDAPQHPRLPSHREATELEGPGGQLVSGRASWARPFREMKRPEQATGEPVSLEGGSSLWRLGGGCLQRVGAPRARDLWRTGILRSFAPTPDGPASEGAWAVCRLGSAPLHSFRIHVDLRGSFQMLPSAALLFGTPRLRVASQCPRRGGAGGRSGWGPGGRGPRPGIGRSLQTLLSKWLVGSGGRDHPGRRGSNNTHSVLTLAPKVRVLARPPPPPPRRRWASRALGCRDRAARQRPRAGSLSSSSNWGATPTVTPAPSPNHLHRPRLPRLSVWGAGLQHLNFRGDANMGSLAVFIGRDTVG